jgi:hypothetical protein
MHLSFIDYAENVNALIKITQDMIDGLVYPDIMDVGNASSSKITASEILKGESIPPLLLKYLSSSHHFYFCYKLWQYLCEFGSGNFGSTKIKDKINERYSLWMNLNFTNFKTVEYTKNIRCYQEMTDIGNF